MYVTDFIDPIQQAEELERLAKEIRERYDREIETKSRIRIGVFIYDKDAKKIAVVNGLENGCIDFSAKYVDGSYERGYSIGVNNWRLATEEEIRSTKEV